MRTISSLLCAGRQSLGRLIGGVLMPFCWVLFDPDPLHAQWVQSDGLYGGFIYRIAVSPNEEGGITSLYVATDSGGVFRSTDNGTSWSAVKSGLTAKTVWTVVAKPNGAGGTILFAGTFGGGVFRSTNYGTQWTAVNNGLADSRVWCLAVFDSVIFAGTYDGIFRSTNNGDSWTAANAGITNLYILSFARDSAGYVYAGTTDGLFRSSDFGITWTAIGNGLTNTYVRALGVYGNFLYAATQGGGVFRSTDNGASWTATSSGIQNHDLRALVIDSSGNLYVSSPGGGVARSTNNGTSWTVVNNGFTSINGNANVRSLAISGTSVFCGTWMGGVHRTTNSGESWTQVNSGLRATHVRAFVSSGTNLFAATDGTTVFRSTDNGETWSFSNDGLTSARTFALARSETTLFVGTIVGVFRSTNDGTSWAATTLMGIHVRAFALSGTHLFAGTQGGVFRSTDNGTSWTATSVTNFVYALGSNVPGVLFAGTDNGIFRSTDNGTSWTPVNAGLTNLTLLALGFDSLGAIYAGTDGGGIFRSTDTGTSWTPLNNGLTNLSVYAFVASSTDFYSGTDDGVFLFNYNNQSWTQADTGLTNPSIRALAVNGPHLLAGTAGAGVFRALESSLPIVLSHFTATVVTPYHVRLDWETISEVNNYGFYVERRFGTEVPFAAVPNSFVPGHGTTNEPRWYSFDDTTIPSPGTYQYRLRQVDLDGTPHYTEPISVITGVTGVGDITPGKFALLQNYPNPFNPSTEIRYQMSEIRHVKLKVFDVLGQEVTTLVDEVKQAGKHSVLFDAGNLPSGVYFYRLTAGSNVETKQMMVLK